MSDINSIAVIGAGTMGAGIAQVAAAAGLNVKLCDVSEQIIHSGVDRISKNLQKAVDKGKISAEDKNTMVSRLSGQVELAQGVKDVQFVIEAATEKLEIKKHIFKALDELCSPEMILATNTSALSISEIASGLSHPQRVVGVHFFNPAPVMRLVELVKSAFTSDEVFLSSRNFIEQLGKQPVEVTEAPGFIVNRLLIPMINEAAYLLVENVATREDIDQAMVLGANHPLGPLALADLVGVDVCLEVMETLYKEFGDSKYRPCPLLRKMVRAGRLGRKSGLGFYEYSRN